MIDQNKANVNPEENDDLDKDFLFNEEKGTYELDIEDDDPDWDHPADYSTISLGAEDDSSDYDTSNPFVGSEYSDIDDLKEEEFEQANMRITDKRILKTSKFDKKISKEERREDGPLDEEGYPINT